MVAVGGDDEKKADFIADAKERMLKWKRMSDSVMKKGRELSTLCDTPTIIVISPPANEDGITLMDSCLPKFAMWPTPTHDDHGVCLRRMIDLYKASRSCKIDSSPSTIEAIATKKVKVSKYNNIDGQATRSVSCGGSLPSIQTGSGDVGLGSALVAVNAQMDQIQTRIDQTNSRKRKSPILDSNAVVDAYGAANAKEKDEVHDVIDFDFLYFPENDNATSTQDHQDDNNSVAVTIHQVAGGKESEQLADSANADMNNDDKFETIFEQQINILRNDSTSWFTNLGSCW